MRTRRVKLEKLHFPSVPQTFPPLQFGPLHYSPEQFLQMASDSIALFNDGQESVFNVVVNTIVPDANIDQFDAEPFPQFVCG